MELTDALTITALGMAVVFSGLLLTAGLIIAFGRFQRLVEAADERREAPPAEPTVAPAAPSGPPLDPEVLTVIATVLEVEHRLNRIDGRTRQPRSSS